MYVGEAEMRFADKNGREEYEKCNWKQKFCENKKLGSDNSERNE